MKYGWADYEAAELEQAGGATIMLGDKIEGVRRPDSPGEATLPALEEALGEKLKRDPAVLGFAPWEMALTYLRNHPRRAKLLATWKAQCCPYNTEPEQGKYYLPWCPPHVVLVGNAADYLVTWLLAARIKVIEKYLHDTAIPLSVRFLLAACQRSCAPLAVALEDRADQALCLKDATLERDCFLVKVFPDPDEAFHAGALPDLSHLFPHCGLMGEPVSTRIKQRAGAKKQSAKAKKDGTSVQEQLRYAGGAGGEKDDGVDTNSPGTVRKILCLLLTFLNDYSEEEDEEERHNIHGKVVETLNMMTAPFLRSLRNSLEYLRYQNEVDEDDLEDLFEHAKETLEKHRKLHPHMDDNGTSSEESIPWQDGNGTSAGGSSGTSSSGNNSNGVGQKPKQKTALFGGAHPWVHLLSKSGSSHCKLRCLARACKIACEVDDSVMQTLMYFLYATLAACYPTDPDHPSFELTKVLYKGFFVRAFDKYDIKMWICDYAFSDRTEEMPKPPTDFDLMRILGLNKLSDLPLRLRPRKRKRTESSIPTGHEKLLLYSLKKYLIYATDMCGSWLTEPLRERRQWDAMKLASDAATSAARRLMEHNLRKINQLERQYYRMVLTQPENTQLHKEFIDRYAVPSDTLMTGVEDLVTDAYNSCTGIQRRSVKLTFEDAILSAMNTMERELYGQNWDVYNLLLKMPEHLHNKETGEDAIEDLKTAIQRFNPSDTVAPELLKIAGVSAATIFRLRAATNAYGGAGSSSKSEAKAVVASLPPSEYAIVKAFYEAVSVHTSIRLYDLPYHTTLAQIAALHIKHDIPADQPLPPEVGTVLICTNCPTKNRRIKCRLSEGNPADAHNFGHQGVVIDPETGKLSCMGTSERAVGKKEKREKDTPETAYGMQLDEEAIEALRRKEYSDARKREAQRRCAEGHIKKINIIGKMMYAYGQMYMICPVVPNGCANLMRYHPARYGPKGLTCKNCASHTQRVVLELCAMCGKRRKESEDAWQKVRVYDDTTSNPMDMGWKTVQFCKKHHREWITDRQPLSQIIKGIQENWGSRQLDNGDIISTQPQPMRERYHIQRQPTRRERFMNHS